MCLIITAAIPRTALTEAFSAVVKKHRLSFAPCDNQHIENQLRRNESYVWATTGSCDCGSPLFCGDKPRSEKALARQVLKLKKQGWNEAKIKKWLEATEPRPVDTKAPRYGQLSVNGWADFLEVALCCPGVAYIALIGHTYCGDVSTELFTLSERIVRTVADTFRVDDFRILEEDVIHEFRRAV